MARLYTPSEKLASLLGDEPRSLAQFVNAILTAARMLGFYTSETRKILKVDRDFSRVLGRIRIQVADLPQLLLRHLSPERPKLATDETAAPLDRRQPGSSSKSVSIRDFASHLRDLAPGFECCRRHDPLETPARMWHVSHGTGRAAPSPQLANLRRRLGRRAAPWLELYGIMNGLDLYVSEEGGLKGFSFFPLGRWDKETKRMRRRYRDMFEENFDDSPGTPLGGVAFGEIPNSGNFVTVQTSGRGRGRIFIVDHDGWTTEPLARDLKHFLGQILADPAAFLYSLGCFLRFTDSSGQEWIPVRYRPDVRTGTAR